MTEKEFLERYNEAPLDADELAIIAINVDGEIGDAAKKFLEAERSFKKILEDIGFEWG